MPQSRLVRIGKWVHDGWPPPAGYDHAAAVTSKAVVCHFGSGKRSPCPARPESRCARVAAIGMGDPHGAVRVDPRRVRVPRKCALPHRGPGRIHSSQQRGIQIVDAPAASGVAGHIRPARPSRLPQAPTPAQASSHHAHPHPPPVRFVTPGQQSVRLSFAATMTSNSYRNRERPAAISWPPE